MYISFDNFTFKVGGCIGTANTHLILLTNFSFDEVSLKSGVKLAVIIFNVRVIPAEVNGTRSHLDPSNLLFSL